MIAILWLPQSLLLAVATLMLSSVAEALPLTHVYTMCDTSRPNTLTITSSNTPIVIKSPNLGLGNYPGNLNCLFELDSGEESLVLTFEFHKFSVQYSYDCRYDFVCIRGVKFCGEWPDDKRFYQVIPAFHESTIVFHTDHKDTQLGFKIVVFARKADNNEIVRQPAGGGSSIENIFYADVKYDPEMPYSDNCLPFSTTSELPNSITMDTSSGIDDISVLNCTCQCPMPAKSPNHYTELGKD